MSTAYYGQPATISQFPMPPAAVNISSSTNAAPTVITTAAAHGLQTGMAVIISGHTTNTNADGIWVVTVLTSTTFKISTFSGFPGTFIAGNGVGGATGTVQSLALPGITLPEDLVDNADAASVNVPFEALADMTAWLAYKVLANMTLLTGSTFDATSTGTLTLTAASGTNNNGITVVGDGSGSGVVATGGGTNGGGVIGQGGATNGRGVVGIGKGTGSGMRASGSVAGSTGIECVGTGGSFALDVGAGNATFTGTAPIKTADPGVQALSAANICKAWGTFTTDGAGNVTNNDGYNIASVSLSGGTHAIVTFARAIAASYAPTVSSGDGLSIPWADVTAATTTVLNVYFNDFAGVAINPATNALIFTLQVFGR